MHFGLITPPDFLDVILSVPTCVGAIVRERYARGQGVFGHFGVHQDVTGKAHDLARAVSMGIGILRFGATETTFGDEVAVNLFAETAGLSGMIKYLLTAFEVLVEAGFSAEKAYGETFYEIQFLVESICRMPFGQAVAFGSPTATYLALTKTGDVVTDDVRDRMRADAGADQGRRAGPRLEPGTTGRMPGPEPVPEGDPGTPHQRGGATLPGTEESVGRHLAVPPRDPVSHRNGQVRFIPTHRRGGCSIPG